MFFFASWGWAVKAGYLPLVGLAGGGLAAFSDIGLDPLDLMDLANKTPSAGGELVLFRKGFVDPDVFSPEGIQDLVNTNPDFAQA
jgi:hypothetical protein